MLGCDVVRSLILTTLFVFGRGFFGEEIFDDGFFGDDFLSLLYISTTLLRDSVICPLNSRLLGRIVGLSFRTGGGPCAGWDEGCMWEDSPCNSSSSPSHSSSWGDC